MLLCLLTGDKQNDLSLFYFQETRGFLQKCLYRMLVDVARSVYVKLANFQTQLPNSRNCFVFNTTLSA